MDISDSQIQRSLERTEKRKLEAAQRRRRQKRNILLALLAVVVAGGALAMGITAGGQPPPVSALTVTWPHGENEAALEPQRIADGSIVLIKPGQSLRIGVPQAKDIDVAWKTSDVQSAGESFDWTPAGESSDLTATISPRLSGWRKALAWTQPSRELHIQGLAGSSTIKPSDDSASGSTASGNTTAVSPVTDNTAVEDAEGFIHEIETPVNGMWLHNRVLTKMPVRFDDRAIKILGESAAQLGGTAKATDAEVWEVVPAFSGDKIAPGDEGTYALLKTAQPVDDARKALKILDRLEPKATLKVIVKEGTAGGACFRLSFDGKGGRFVWVQAEGETKATPQDWMKEIRKEIR